MITLSMDSLMQLTEQRKKTTIGNLMDKVNKIREWMRMNILKINASRENSLCLEIIDNWENTQLKKVQEMTLNLHKNQKYTR